MSKYTRNDQIYKSILDLHTKVDERDAMFEKRLDKLEANLAFNKGVTKVILVSASCVGVLIGTFAEGIKAKLGSAISAIAKVIA